MSYNRKEILERMRTNITDLDLQRYFPETHSSRDNVMKYSELADVKSIYDILPTDRSYKIILIEDHYNSGHWTAIMRYGDTIETFDSYGLEPDGELKFINKVQKLLLGEDKKYLTKLLDKVKDSKKVWNKKKLQKLSNGSATCGRWVILRICMMKDFGFTLKEFQDFVKKYKDEYGLTTDELVSFWVK
jgi:hypothetical protein